MHRLWITVLCLTTGFAAGNARADDDNSKPPPRRVISVDVGGLIYTVVTTNPTQIPIKVEYESAIFDHLSLYAAPHVGVGLNPSTLNYGLGVGARVYFLNGPALQGLWIGPEVGLVYGTATATGTTASFGFSLGAAAGYNLILGSFLIGPGVNLAIGGLGSPTVTVVWSPRVNLGFTF